MMNFFGGDGGGGAGASAGCGAAAGGGVASAICPPFEFCISLELLEEPLCFFLVGSGFGFSAGGAAAVSGAGCGAGAAAMDGPTCKLLTTSFTPGTAAACRLAASRCASLSTLPPSVTTPFADCTESCFEESPESWLNLL